MGHVPSSASFSSLEFPDLPLLSSTIYLIFFYLLFASGFSIIWLLFLDGTMNDKSFTLHHAQIFPTDFQDDFSLRFFSSEPGAMIHECPRGQPWKEPCINSIHGSTEVLSQICGFSQKSLA